MLSNLEVQYCWSSSIAWFYGVVISRKYNILGAQFHQFIGLAETGYCFHRLTLFVCLTRRIACCINWWNVQQCSLPPIKVQGLGRKLINICVVVKLFDVFTILCFFCWISCHIDNLIHWNVLKWCIGCCLYGFSVEAWTIGACSCLWVYLNAEI